MAKKKSPAAEADQARLKYLEGRAHDPGRRASIEDMQELGRLRRLAKG